MQVNSEIDSGAQEGLPQTIAGFRVVRRLATGGTSDVLLARANGPNGFERTVVLKLLLAQYKDDPSFERMFAIEAAAYARLAHPSIVKLYDFFASGDQLVMVLEHVDGLPLNALRAELTNAGEVLEDRAVFYLMSRVFAALAAAHAARDPETRELSPVIHRDVNPSNVLIHRDGSVKLADFGIAKVTGMAGDTKTGFIKGTFGYMSPEQVRGEQVTVRADVYAATLLLWELLARRRAIQHGALSDLEALRAMAHPNIVSLDVLRGDLSPELRKIIARGLEAAAESRSVTAAELSEALEDAGSSEEGRARLISAVEKASSSGAASLSQTAPSPTVSESMAMLAEADADDTVPPLPSYSVPAPPLSDSDFADTTLNAAPLSSRRSPQKSVPDDVPTKPAGDSEIAQALSAEDSLELPRFPMPSMSDAPPARGSEPKPPPRSDPKNALDAATDAPSSSRRGKEASRLGAPVAPRPVIPRPMSVAPGAPTTSPSPSPRAVTVSSAPSAMTELKPPSSPAGFKPKTMMGGFTATPSSPPPTDPPADPPKPTTAPMAIVPAAGISPVPERKSVSGPLSTTLAMAAPAGARSSPNGLNAQSGPPPILAANRQPETGGALFRAMPTSPASFAPMAPNTISATPSRGTARLGWLLAAIGGFLSAAALIAVVVVHVLDKPSVTVGSPKVVVTSSPSAVAAPTQRPTAAASPNVATTATASARAVVSASPTATSPTAVNSATSAPSATATPSAAATAAAPAIQIPPQSAALVAGKEARQHRVFVDGKPIGEGPGTYFVPCGTHTVKIGSSGKPHDIDAACGTSINVP